MQDNSDNQYRSFRNNIPVLSLLAGVYLVIKFIYTRSAISSSHNYSYLVRFNVAFSILMLSALHGTSILKIFVILTINYSVAKYCKGSKLGPLLTWVFNISVLFANERNSGYRFGDILPALEILVRFLYSSTCMTIQGSTAGQSSRRLPSVAY